MYIGQLAKMTGASRKAIYLYERMGLLPMPRRQGVYRVYGQQDAEIIALIKCAQSLGFRLKELAEMGPGQLMGAPPARVQKWLGSARRQGAAII